MASSKRIRVVAALVQRDGRWLIAQRSWKGSFPGKWEFPGGKVQVGEDDQVALSRELSEELGVNSTIGSYVCEVDHDYADLSVKIVFYRCELPSVDGLVVKDHSDLRWVLPADIESYDCLEADIAVFQKIKESELI
jgi:mutator protein MutT